MSFKNLIGNEDIKQSLSNAIKKNKILHSYLFYGPEGIGKEKFAREFAKMILCITKQENCSTCKSCIEFNTDNNPDFLKISPEKDSIKIEQIRQMQSTTLEKPIVSNKVYIIDDADKLTIDAQNCLLKTLEEPPSFVTIILIASNDSKLLPTIKSRCSKVVFKKIDDKLLEEFLENKYDLTNLTEDKINSFQGSIKNALRYIENKEIYDELDTIFTEVEQYNYLDVLNNLDVLYKNKESINEILDYIKYIFYKKIKKDTKYISYIEEIENTKNRLRSNANFDMCIDRLLFKIWEENH